MGGRLKGRVAGDENDEELLIQIKEIFTINVETSSQYTFLRALGRSILEELRAFVRQTYPQAIEVATSNQIWIQSSEGGQCISRAYNLLEYGPECLKLAWESAKVHCVIRAKGAR